MRAVSACWIKASRLFRHYPLPPASPRPSGRRPRLETLEDRLAPGEAAGTLLNSLTGASLIDPLAATLALLGEAPPVREAPAPVGASPAPATLATPAPTDLPP